MLCLLEGEGVARASSADLGALLDLSAHLIRKDISFFGGAGSAGAGYDVGRLKALIAEQLGFGREKRACIVGLGRLGSALLEYAVAVPQEGYRIVAGFDSNINRIETLSTAIDLFAVYEIVETLQRLQIELALIAVPAEHAQAVADRCCDGGVTGILNFAPMNIKPKNPGVFIRSMNVAGELRILTALSHVYLQSKHQ